MYRTLKLTMFERGPGGYPCLRGKASEIKHIGRVLLEVWQEGMDVANPLHVALKLALETGVQLDAWIDDYQDCHVFSAQYCTTIFHDDA